MFNSNDLGNMLVVPLVCTAIFFMVVGMIVYAAGSWVFNHLVITWN